MDEYRGWKVRMEQIAELYWQATATMQGARPIVARGDFEEDCWDDLYRQIDDYWERIKALD